MSHPQFERKRVYKNLIENEVIDILLNWSHLRAFLSGTYYPDRKSFYDYKGFYVTKTILRKQLRLAEDKKPGDIDVLIIPFSQNKIYFENTSVYEIKIVRPTLANPSRNANSLGVSQVLGLVEDGFPSVSLIHICLTEPLPEDEKMNLKFSTLKGNSGIGREKGKTFDDYLIDVKVDYFSWWSSENQIKRLLTHDIPDFVGINSFGLDFYEDGSMSMLMSDFSHEYITASKYNPKTSPLTILKIKNHFKKYSCKYEKVIIGKI